MQTWISLGALLGFGIFLEIVVFPQEGGVRLGLDSFGFSIGVPVSSSVKSSFSALG